MKKQKVEIVTNAKVGDLIVNEGKAIGVKYIQNGIEKNIEADKIIIATGGASYKATGSTGDGYEIAKKYGHTINTVKPGLVPLECHEKNLCKELQGLSLRNIAIKLVDKEKNLLILE